MQRIFIIFLLFMLGCSATIQYKTQNNSKAPTVVRQINNHLKLVYPDNVYNKTGIKAMSFYNMLVVIYNNKNADKYGLSLYNVYKEIFNAFSNSGYNASGFRYIAVGNYGDFTAFGNAVFIDGAAFQNFLGKKDFEGLYAHCNKLTTTFQLEADPDVDAILREATAEVDYDANWGKEEERAHTNALWKKQGNNMA